MSNENSKDRIVILNKGRGPRYEKQFFVDIQEAILNGYRIAQTDDRLDASMRNFRGSIGRAVLYKEGAEPKPKAVVKASPAPIKEAVKEPEAVEMTNSEKLEKMTKKADLLKFAKELSIDVDDDIVAPQKIKKVIREALKS